MRALARHLQAVRDRSNDSPPHLDLPMVTRAHSWTFRCKPLMSNARILAQLEKFARDNNAETMSLNQRLPGSSPGAPTKSNQVLAMIKHQIGSFSWEAGLIRSQLRPGNWALIRFILCFFTPHANEIQRADRFAQGQLHTDRRIG